MGKAKRNSRPIEILTADEAMRLIDAPSRRAPTGVRNRALLVILYRAGLRISEALALKPKDIDPKQGSISILHGKGNKARVVGMDPEGFAELAVWMERRQALGFNGRQPVFCTLKGGSLDTSYVRCLFQRLKRKAGIEKRVHPHGLRHTFAAQLAQEGVPINVIQPQLGHASAATTARYIEHISPQSVLDAMRGRGPWKGDDEQEN